MQGNRDNKLDLEKMEIAKRLGELERTVAKCFSKLNGDPDANPPIESQDARIKRLEKLELERDGNKQTLIKTALGSVTIAVGAIVLWILTVLRDAFIKH